MNHLLNDIPTPHEMRNKGAKKPKMVLAHLSPHELEIMNYFQGGQVLGKHDNVPELSKFWELAKNPHIQEMMVHAHREKHSAGGGVGPQHLSASLDHHRHMGRYGDTRIARMPSDMAEFFDRQIGGRSHNPHDGHPEYFNLGGLLSGLSSIGGKLMGALGPKLGSLASSLSSGAGSAASALSRGASSMAGGLSNMASRASNSLSGGMSSLASRLRGAPAGLPQIGGGAMGQAPQAPQAPQMGAPGGAPMSNIPPAPPLPMQQQAPQTYAQSWANRGKGLGQSVGGFVGSPVGRMIGENVGEQATRAAARNLLPGGSMLQYPMGFLGRAAAGPVGASLGQAAGTNLGGRLGEYAGRTAGGAMDYGSSFMPSMSSIRSAASYLDPVSYIAPALVGAMDRQQGQEYTPRGPRIMPIDEDTPPPSRPMSRRSSFSQMPSPSQMGGGYGSDEDEFYDQDDSVQAPVYRSFSR